MTSIAILGPGGVGGFLSGALARDGEEPLVIAREQTAELISRDGLDVKSVRLGDFRAKVRAVPALREPVEFLLIAAKANGLSSSLERIRTQPGLVVPLLNGLDHMVTLRARFGDDGVAAGTIRIEADRPEPGRIVQTSPFLRVDLASDRPGAEPALRQLGETLERAEVPAELGPSEAQILWLKLVRLNALALTTSASNRTLGFIRSDPEWRRALEGCLSEGAAAANADGATVDAAVPMGELEQAHEGLGSSMQRDIAAGREPELDAIAGSVLRAAARHGIPCPTIARLAQQIAERAGVPPPRWPG